jgi:hypothetical protein
MAEQPAHPDRGFGDKEQVHKNWSGMFERFPDLEVEVLRQSTEGDVVWSEWHWSATGLQMAGVTVIGIREDRIFWARLYMEPVEQAGQDIDEAMRTITGKDGGRRVIRPLPYPRSGRPDAVFGLCDSAQRCQSTSASKPCSPERSASVDSTSSAESSGT